MKIAPITLLEPVALFALLLVAFFISDHFNYRQGANDMGRSLLVFTVGALIIAGFFIRSIYKAVAVHKSYWLVVGIYLLCAALFVAYFMV